METIATAQKNKTAIFSASNIIWAISQLFVALFLYTALNKLTDPGKFWGTLNGSQLLQPYATFFTYAVPLIELVICIPLLFNFSIGKRNIPARKIGLIAGGVLMLLFTVYIIVMLLLYSNDMPCSCGGFIKELSWTAHIFFNLAFVGLAVWALLLYKRVKHA